MGTRNNIDLKNRKTELEEAIENDEPKKLVKLLNIFTKKFKTFQKCIFKISEKDNLQKIGVIEDNEKIGVIKGNEKIGVVKGSVADPLYLQKMKTRI